MGLELIKPVHDILDRVVEVSHKKVEFIEKNDTPTFAAIKMARKNMPAHLIFHKKEHNEFVNHLIAHECGHIIRTFLAPAEKRVMPSTDQETKKIAFTEMEDDIKGMSSFLSVDKIAQVMNLWYTGTVRQVTNFPPDIMIEKWLYEYYPKLRPYQLESIKKQHSEAIQGLKDSVRQLTPAKIFNASNVMNYAFFRIIGYHIGTNFLTPYNQTPFVRRGKDLAAYTSANYVDNFDGDISMIGYWTDYFNLSKWYRWTGFENIPEDYLQMH
jgi:hypothetical protein